MDARKIIAKIIDYVLCIIHRNKFSIDQNNKHKNQNITNAERKCVNLCPPFWKGFL